MSSLCFKLIKWNPAIFFPLFWLHSIYFALEEFQKTICHTILHGKVITVWKMYNHMRSVFQTAVCCSVDDSSVAQSVLPGPHGERDGARRGRDCERWALPERRQRPASQVHQRLGAGAADHHVGAQSCTQTVHERDGWRVKQRGVAEGEVNIFG